MAGEVLVVMGSDSDFAAMKPCVQLLRRFGVSFEAHVCSAHRTPAALHALVERMEREGMKLVIAGAGGAAHLAGVCAAISKKPVIGVPIDSSALEGVDSLYSTVQMPPGVPVAAMGIGEAGATNAALFAVEILALSDKRLAERHAAYRTEMAESVAKKDALLQKELERLSQP